MAHRAFLPPLFSLTCLLAGQGLPAQVTPVAGPFQVSPRSYGFDEPGNYWAFHPALAALADGSFVVAWDEDLVLESGGNDTLLDIYRRQVHPDGTLGPTYLVDRGGLNVDLSPEAPELAGDGRGGYALVWTRSYFGGADLLYEHVGSGTDGIIFPERDGAITSSAVATNAAGDWVIAWQADPLDGTDRLHVAFRAFHASGKPSSREIRIRPADPHVSLSNPRVAFMADGFVLVWEASGGPRPKVLQGRSFAPDGTPLGPIFQVGRQPGAWDVLSDGSDELWVAWQSVLPTHRETIRLSHYTSAGARLETRRIGTSNGPWRAHMNRRGEIAFAWTEPDNRVLLQVLDQLAVPKGTRQWVTRALRDSIWSFDVAISDTGSVLAVWTSTRRVTTPFGAVDAPLAGKLWQVQE